MTTTDEAGSPASVAAQNHRRLLNVADEFKTALINEAKYRDDRQELLPSGELAWVVHERVFMCDLVNVVRAEQGLGTVAVDQIAAVESSASGHADYASKFALYCAEIALSKEQAGKKTPSPTHRVGPSGPSKSQIRST